MFWFSRKKKKIFQDNESSISFTDMIQQKIDLSVERDGNGDVFKIFSQSKTNTTQFLLDREQCLLLSEILKDYSTHGNINNSKAVLMEE